MEDSQKLFTKVKKVVPTHVGQKCPVCNGFRTVSNQHIPCVACEAKGYILVPAKEVENGGMDKNS